VFAGENITTPALVTVSITERVTDDDAAPMMASTSWASRSSTVPWAMPFSVSPESPSRCWTGLSSTPPAAFISCTARLIPANSGGPRNANTPVLGNSEPNSSVPSPPRSTVTGTWATSASAGASAMMNSVFASSMHSTVSAQRSVPNCKTP
jgi:hypothetical protein